MLGTQERPVISGVSKRLAALCKQRGERAPSRSSIYNAVDRAEPPSYSVADLPPAVQRTLHNLDVAVIGGGSWCFTPSTTAPGRPAASRPAYRGCAF
jgi:hypothetical protein